MTTEDYLLSVIRADSPRPGLGPAALRGFLAGCSALYDIGLETYLAAERAGIRRRGTLPAPVISVGNLTVGGTGKTPMTAMLCRRLQERGLRVTILSRGHGGSSNDARVVSTPGGEIVLNSADAGDEPVLLSRLCPGIPVVVGKDRRLSGREALRHWPVDVFVLDDGFQFWQLVRNLDIVLLDSKLPFDNGYPLPRGLLREPARHIRRAHIAVVTRADRLDAAGRQTLIDRVHAYAPHMPVYFASHAPAGLVPINRAAETFGHNEWLASPTLSSPLPSEERAPSPQGITPVRGGPGEGMGVRASSHSHFGTGSEERAGVGVVALSAIAQPESFYRTLTDSMGCDIARKLTFPDHHRFTDADVAAAAAAVAETGASALVMTEKDAVKWPSEAAWSVDMPVLALRIAMQVENEDAFIADMLKRAGVDDTRASD
jgi:tetraacyldisaccharide 4'-kinase